MPSTTSATPTPVHLHALALDGLVRDVGSNMTMGMFTVHRLYLGITVGTERWSF